MDKWNYQSKRIKHISQLVHPGCAVRVRTEYTPMAVGLQIISARGDELCNFLSIDWLKGVSEMTDSDLFAKIVECTKPATTRC
jgi:hypothetical protein